MQGINKQLNRYLGKNLDRIIKSRHSCLILGPRQVGKTTLVKKCLKDVSLVLEYPLQNPSVRISLERDTSKIIREAQAQDNPFVFVDEAQKIPDVFDVVQFLIDNKEAQFILSGSSARKLKRSGANLLPGRIIHYRLDPLLWGELGHIQKSSLDPLRIENINVKSDFTFFDSLVWGSLPKIVGLNKNDRESFLRSYSEIYLEEEIRAEALSRKIGAFSRFLELAAAESGTNPNFSKLSNESGVSQPAIKEFYNLLEDTLVAERIDPYLKSARKRILSTSRYYFFDIGVRNALARLPLTVDLVAAQKGILFEHAIILEIIRRIRVLDKNYKVCYWRTSGGAEVDCVLDMGSKVIPIEIKASPFVASSEIKGLKIFLEDYKKVADHGYVITMGERKEKIAENITALPWPLL